jgi:hypothetical protein
MARLDQLPKDAREAAVNPHLKQWSSLADATLFPVFVIWYIWQLEFVARWAWVLFVVWLIASFLLHGDSAKTLGWSGVNLWPATRQALWLFGLMALGLVVIGLVLGASWHPGPISWERAVGYLVFCAAQQLGLNSLLHNRILSLVRNEWVAAGLTGAIFAACHWPNPVLVPVTFVGGAAMAWMFGRVRNLIPVAIGQAVLGLLVGWAFPVAWHHHMRIGPGYYRGA